jgi:hypothetical protein
MKLRTLTLIALTLCAVLAQGQDIPTDVQPAPMPQNFGDFIPRSFEDRRANDPGFSGILNVDSVTALRIKKVYPPNQPDSTEGWPGQRITVLASVDSTGHVTINDFYIRSVFNVGVALWDEYEKECYADSMEVKDPLYVLLLANGLPTEISWEHKRSTLAGFMDFIRRKVGK